MASEKLYRNTLRPADISCHTVSLVYLNFARFVVSFVTIFAENKKLVPFVGELLIASSCFKLLRMYSAEVR